MSAKTVTSELGGLNEVAFRQFPITTSVTAAQMIPAPLSVSSITRSGRTVTVTTASAHNYFVGQYVKINAADQEPYNGKRKITAIPSDVTFQYEIPAGGSGGVPDPELPVTPATGTITTSTEHYARRVRVRTGANGADTVGIGPTAAADYYQIPASTEWELPIMPDDSCFNLADWYVKASANTPTIKVLYN